MMMHDDDRDTHGRFTRNQMVPHATTASVSLAVLVLVGILAFVLFGCVSPQSNLARLQTECALAPLAEIGSSFIPIPGAGGVLNLTISAVCAHPELIAADEAAIAAAVGSILRKKAAPR